MGPRLWVQISAGIVHDWGHTLEQGTEPPTAPRAPQCRLPTAPGVCALGWFKCREHISLLVILCIILYVTNKAHHQICKHQDATPVNFWHSCQFTFNRIYFTVKDERERERETSLHRNSFWSCFMNEAQSVSNDSSWPQWSIKHIDDPVFWENHTEHHLVHAVASLTKFTEPTSVWVHVFTNQQYVASTRLYHVVINIMWHYMENMQKWFILYFQTVLTITHQLWILIKLLLCDDIIHAI